MIMVRYLILFFVLVLVLCYPISGISATQSSVCEKDSSAQLMQVKRVIDADTLVLSNGQRVRLIGIDAPELGRRGKPDEPFAREGTEALRQKIQQSGNRIWVQPGVEMYDRYDRLLADLFFEEGRSIQGWLLEQGFAMQVFVAPNLRYADCLASYEQQAKRRQQGIWSLPEYQSGIPSSAVPNSVQGAVIISGQIVRVGQSQANVWLNLEGGVAIQIPREAFTQFNLEARKLEGEKVRVRGWIIRDDSRHHVWRIRIEDPRALERL